ncbi:MAG TPA: maleylpyruvate isomerase N-terminal domain-containing protein [Acidimicrobiales bacterium]|nr:maleylpyruvate isomerase N-terminal domain-containing protein [Acidimicrobiales bacterium]
MTNRPDPDIEGATAAHARLLATIGALTDDAAGRPSLLPGWTVGHVLTHVARNADSHVRILAAAASGESVEQYQGGRAARESGIEVGAGRRATELVDDVGSASARLEELWASVPDETWDGHGFNADGDRWPCAQLPFHRWREVEVHLVDLGLGPSWVDWPDAYVARELPRVLTTLPHRLADAAARRQLTAWLLDRGPSPGDGVVGKWVLGGWEEAPSYYGR